ncbi:MAG: molybdate ABC transporter substrate-binding protein [Pseudomonadales bacterium]|nr:molybdate ABC transporter substrate-binding protein [Pseudomonadales bacterium]
MLKPAFLTRLACLLVSCVLGSAPAQAQPATIAAASDLQFALEAVREQYRLDTGRQVQVVYGSSGNFYRQIREGAPFQMFMSADESYVQQLADAGLTEDAGTLYAEGRIVLITPHGSVLKADTGLQGLGEALDSHQIQRFAIANPEHAPYGRRAEEALRHAGLWEALQGHLVLGENVSQAAQFATSGSTQGGIIAYSLALSPNVSRLGDYALIPQDWHEPLHQRMVLLRTAPPALHEFYAYLQGPRAREIMRDFGFELPEAR